MSVGERIPLIVLEDAKLEQVFDFSHNALYRLIRLPTRVWEEQVFKELALLKDFEQFVGILSLEQILTHGASSPNLGLHQPFAVWK